MSGHPTHGTDTKAAFMGLIGGAIFIGVILYGIVLLTNMQFAGKHAAAGEHKAAVTAVTSPALA